MTLERGLVQKIHIAKHQMRLPEDVYRAMLAGYDVHSSTELTSDQAQNLLNEFRKKGWDPGAWQVNWDPRMRKAWYIWQQVSRSQKKYAAFKMFCKRFKTSPGRAKGPKANAVLEAVKGMAARAAVMSDE